MKKTIFISTLVLLLASCSSDVDLLQPTSNESQSISREGYKVSVDEAVRMARRAVSECGGAFTRSCADANVSVIRSEMMTRSGDIPDTLLYVVNFENQSGFAIIGADMRILPLYAVSDTGELNITENSPEALKIIMNGIQSDAIDRIMSGPEIGSKPPTPTNPRFPELDYVYGWEEVEETPLLMGKFQNNVTYYGQYSKYIFTTDGLPTYTGCVAVSAEQLMSFYHWPEQIDDYKIDWDRIERECDVDAVATILERLGRSSYLNMYYTVDRNNNNAPQVCGAQYDIVINALRNLNYKSAGSFVKFLDNEERARKILENAPLLFYSSSYRWKDGKRYRHSGHNWIIDGWKSYWCVTPGLANEDSGLIDYNRKLDSKGYLYHCVWGDWEGCCNGYYYITTWDGERGFFANPEEYGENDTQMGSDDEAEIHRHNEIFFLNNVIAK